jgi:hypothetical protein
VQQLRLSSFAVRTFEVFLGYDVYFGEFIIRFFREFAIWMTVGRIVFSPLPSLAHVCAARKHPRGTPTASVGIIDVAWQIFREHAQGHRYAWCARHVARWKYAVMLRSRFRRQRFKASDMKIMAWFCRCIQLLVLVH